MRKLVGFNTAIIARAGFRICTITCRKAGRRCVDIDRFAKRSGVISCLLRSPVHESVVHSLAHEEKSKRLVRHEMVVG